MNKRELFIRAHDMTKAIMETGDDYRITFGACLKVVREENRVDTVRESDVDAGIAQLSMLALMREMAENTWARGGMSDDESLDLDHSLTQAIRYGIAAARQVRHVSVRDVFPPIEDYMVA